MPNAPLITGFNAYGSLRANPSEELIHWVQERFGARVRTMILPTEYGSATLSLQAAIRDLRPISVVMFGYTSRSSGLRIEAQADNRVASRGPDNSGSRLRGRIDEGGPPFFQTVINVDQLAALINRKSDVAYVSKSAGSFVCNFTYYRVLDWLRRQGAVTPAVFVHVSQAPRASPVLADGLQMLVELAIADKLPLKASP